MNRRALGNNGIRVGRSTSGSMLWVIDPEFPHPAAGKVYAFNLTSGEMRDYPSSLFFKRLREVTDEGRKVAIDTYLEWKQAKGGSFAEEVARRVKIKAEEATKRELEAVRLKRIRAEEADKRQREALHARERKIRLLAEGMLQSQARDAFAIRKNVEARQIQFLVHFTRLENLRGILERGILPVSSLGQAGIRNDTERLDGYKEAVSLSVSFPHYQMFYKYRCLNPNANWVVLGISPEILTEIPCLFFPTNAASRTFQNHNDDQLRGLMGASGFSGMFADREGCRQERGLPERFTTDPQAEVLVFAPVPPAMILGVRFLRSDSDAEILARQFLPASWIAVGGRFFDRREDWRHWWTESKSDATFSASIE